MHSVKTQLQGLLADGILCLIYWLIPYVFDLGCSSMEFYYNYMEFPIAAAIAVIIFSVAALSKLRKGARASGT